ncbi:uncharacterized protein SOCG_01888 [Schizosaccharomyces octosporus yFS286]|uniref:Amino acid transporter n=1 Tax=Schizosaccharomyces octosporus (strain yFS286) TaxID=483514 RepID=S9PW27_SCHOY|nr:uncharacterized protein SOCG_01888 [Schizosaccharomyces octosporus yFS286]EPX71673.1 hypothetical protein SOCG_01888 [Schizosaccharomyces octosporus yFS286]
MSIIDKQDIKKIEVNDEIELGESKVADRDDEFLISLGYKPEFTREFSYLSIFGQSFGSMGLCPAISGSLIFSMNCGGGGMVWSWIIGCLCLVPVTISLGELASSMPTSGGLYFWVFKLAPPAQRLFLCWACGYVSVLGYATIYASTIYSTSSMIQALAMINNPLYSSTKYEQYGIYVALLLVTSATAVIPSRVIAKLNIFNITFQLSLSVIFILALAFGSNPTTRNPGNYIFGDFKNYSGWSNTGWAFMLSFTTPVWVVSGFESSAVIAEESTNAAKAAPFAMVSSVIVAAILGWCIIITIVATMGNNFKGVSGSSLGQPVAQVLLNNLGTKGAKGIFSLLVIALYLNSVSLVIASSREVFAFCRDGGIPGSKFFKHLTKQKVPLNAILLVFLYSISVGLLILVNASAISSVFNLAIIALYIAYSCPLLCRFICKNFEPGIFYAGKWSKLLASWSLLWMWFMIIMLLFPEYQNPSQAQMNWAIVVLGFVMLFCIVYYYIPKVGGKTFFRGPVSTL